MVVVIWSCHKTRHSLVSLNGRSSVTCNGSVTWLLERHCTVFCIVLQFWMCVCVCVWCIVICVMIAWYNYGRTWRMPTCSLLKIMHDKWLQQSGNKMTCMYEAIAGSVICAFMHIANYMMCLKGGSTSKRCDTIPLRLKVTTKNKDPKLLADAMKFYQGQKILTLWIVSWRGPSSLGTPNKNLPCLGELIVTHIDQTNWIVSFISLTHENLSTHKE